MDSSGLGLIMGRLGVMRELGGELAVFHPSRETRRIIALAGMERLVQIEYAPDDPPSSTASDIPGVPDGKTSGAGDASERVVVCTRRRGTSAPRPRRPRATPKTTIRKEKDA